MIQLIFWEKYIENGNQSFVENQSEPIAVILLDIRFYWAIWYINHPIVIN